MKFMTYSERKENCMKYARKRRPTARDREIAEFICEKLPLGYHGLWVEIEDGSAFLKPEGGSIIWFGNKRISIIPKQR